MELKLDICAFCDVPTWCYSTHDGPMCRGCHIVGYIGGVLYRPIGLKLLTWQEKWLREVYGTCDVETGERAYWKSYTEIPGKNGKSFLCGALPLYHLDAEGVSRAQAFGMASARNQAGIVYRSALHLVRENPDPDFRAKWKLNESTFRVIHRHTAGYYRVISADGGLNDGEEPSLAIYDELHRWKTQAAQTLYEVMNKGTISRDDAMSIEITTAGSQDDSPICWRQHERARRILAGSEKPGRLHVTVYAADEERHKQDPEYWLSREARVTANPSHEDNGGFLRDEKLVAQIKEMGPTAYRRYHLNLWGQKEERWLKSGEWARGNAETRPLLGRACYIGIDLSSTTDFTSMELIFPDLTDDSYDWIGFCWVPKARVPDLEKRLHVDLARWIDEGLVIATPGDYVDYSAVEKKIEWATQDFDVQEVCYDPWNATDLVTRLSTAGYVMVKTPQNIVHISAPTKHLHRKLLEGKVRHGGNEVLAWCANGAIARTDANGNIAIRKPDLAKDSFRVDRLAGGITALSRGMINEEQFASATVYSVGS